MTATLHLLKGDLHLPDVEGFDGELSVENMRRLLGEITALRDKLTGAGVTINSQAGIIGKLTRQANPATHPQHAEIVALVDRWKHATDHLNARRSEDRFKMVKARLKEGYTFDEMALAIDGLAAFRYVVSAQRVANGKPSQRFDQMKHALGGGEKLEQMANLGALARRQA